MALAQSAARRRAELEGALAHLEERYWRDEPIHGLIADLTQAVDRILVDAWEDFMKTVPEATLFAVGGYGRAELHPKSDIDILVLCEKPERYSSEISQFLQAVFDLNVDVGHSVRDLKACVRESKADITVATALFERRLIAGNAHNVDRLNGVLGNKKVWSVADFYAAKHKEQIARHRQYDSVDYKLEPNIKTSPGGLRDIQTGLWIVRRQFGMVDLEDLVTLGVLSPQEHAWLVQGRDFLFWVRFGLHLLASRNVDQLYFARQRELSQRLGFKDTPSKSAVENFMYHYYRHVLALTEVNDILLQHFEEHVVGTKIKSSVVINERFTLVNDKIAASSDDVFLNNPSAMLEIFLIMAMRKEDISVRAATIRLLRDALHLIDDDFRSNPENCRLFMQLLKAPYTVVTQLTRMRRYGVLGRYLPEFGEVIGQMQHDLFHIYTVDAHTMMVISNMRRFRYPEAVEKFPIAHRCVQAIPKPELLYIAGLFHDIGKGRGGDHSELGALDAEAFCSRHGMNEADSALVQWLVKKHLLMSSVSQHQDIYDPEVIQSFAQEVKSEMRLDYLYALTVADINATNPTLWNSWRASLMRHLYGQTRNYLRSNPNDALDRQTTIAAYQESALEQLQTKAEERIVAEIWDDLGDDFFLRHNTQEIVALTRDILNHQGTEAFVSLSPMQYRESAAEGATKIYIIATDRPKTFAATVVTLARSGLSVVDAQLTKTTRGRYFNTFAVINDNGLPMSDDPALRQRLIDRVKATLSDPSPSTDGSNRRISRQHRELNRQTEVTVSLDDSNASVITVLASNRPGLLATIALAMLDLELQISSARITTLGEMVEDVFVVTDHAGMPVTNPERIYEIEISLRQHLDSGQ